MAWHIRTSTKPDSSSASIIQLTVQCTTSFNRDMDSHVNKNYAGQYESRDFYPPLKTYLLRWATLRISSSFLYVECELLISWLALGIYLRYWYKVDSHYLSQESTHNPSELLLQQTRVNICVVNTNFSSTKIFSTSHWILITLSQFHNHSIIPIGTRDIL